MLDQRARAWPRYLVHQDHRGRSASSVECASALVAQTICNQGYKSMSDIKQWNNDSLLQYHSKLNSMEWKRNIAISKQTDRHKGINFDNPRFNKHKAEVKQELENRGLI